MSVLTIRKWQQQLVQVLALMTRVVPMFTLCCTTIMVSIAKQISKPLVLTWYYRMPVAQLARRTRVDLLGTGETATATTKTTTQPAVTMAATVVT
jgi:hypothetical protein